MIDDTDYCLWLRILGKDFRNVREFDLFGTKAALLWNAGVPEIEVICITAFCNKKPVTKKFEHFGFNIVEKYWTSFTPKGSRERIREELMIAGLLK